MEEGRAGIAGGLVHKRRYFPKFACGRRISDVTEKPGEVVLFEKGKNSACESEGRYYNSNDFRKDVKDPGEERFP